MEGNWTLLTLEPLRSCSLFSNLPCTFAHVIGNRCVSISRFGVCVWRSSSLCGVEVVAGDVKVIGQNESNQPEEARGSALKDTDH